MTLRDALADAATPGPWERPRNRPTEVLSIDGYLVAVAEREADAAYIAAAPPEVVLALLDVVDAARPYVDGYDPDLPGLEEDDYRLLRALARYEEVSHHG